MGIARGVKAVYEKHHGVKFSDEALRAAVDLSSKYIKQRFLPDKVIDLMDEAGAKVGIEASHEARHMAGLLHAAGGDKRRMLKEAQTRQQKLSKELEHLKRLEAEMIGESEITEVRGKIEHMLQQLNKMETEKREEAPTVTVDDIKKIVSEWAGMPIEKVI